MQERMIRAVGEKLSVDKGLGGERRMLDFVNDISRRMAGSKHSQKIYGKSEGGIVSV